jgi:hypothetical protein
MGCRFLSLAALLAALGALPQAPAGAPKETKSALETDPSGWLDLLGGKGLAEWKRVPIPPGSKLRARDPWSLDRETKHLVCDGVGVHEMLLYGKELGDGVLHVEWRFRKVEGKKGYNSGVYVRNSADGKIWHQAQVGSKNVGYLFGQTLTGGKRTDFRSSTVREVSGQQAGGSARIPFRIA